VVETGLGCYRLLTITYGDAVNPLTPTVATPVQKASSARPG